MRTHSPHTPPKARRRLEFFLDQWPVGVYLNRGYPTTPGRYRYEPFRGTGHLRLVQTLGQGQAAECWHWRRRKQVRLVVVEEVFVLGVAGADWFLTISEVGSKEDPTS
jgi:hypothetical protein